MYLLFLVWAYFALLSSAGITLSNFQAIVDFSNACTSAYNTPIQNCDGNLFAPFNNHVACSSNCYNELNSLVSTIQSACQTAGVIPNTVMAHAFQGDLAQWMCGQGTYASAAKQSEVSPNQE